MDEFVFLLKEPEKRVRSLIKKLTHSGETDLDKELLVELKKICKSTPNDELIVVVYKECMKCLHKSHSQVRVATVKLLDYLFQKAHIIREKLLDDFDIFLELTLAISQKPKVKLVLPPPKKYASLLQELTAKLIHSWHADFGCGYDKLRYAHRFLREHRLVDFNRFRVQTHEQLLKRQKLAEKQEKILTRNIENRIRELRELRPEIEQLLVQIESLLDLLVDSEETIDVDKSNGEIHQVSDLPDAMSSSSHQREFGIACISQRVQIEFSPYVKVQRNRDNIEVVKNLKELKRQLIDSKLTKLIAIERTLCKKSDQFINTLKEIIDLKNKAMNVVLKLGELAIVIDPDDVDESTKNKLSTLDKFNSDSDSDFEEVEPKEGLETYIPKSMRLEYGLEASNLEHVDDSAKIKLTDESFDLEFCVPSTSSSSPSLAMPCNVRLESGKLCPRRDKVKCPFHGRIIPRDHNGLPLNEEDRREEEKKTAGKANVPDWQDPELLRDIKAATGIDLTMPAKGRKKDPTKQKLANTKTCDLTPKQRLKKRLSLLSK